jgi:hypothetical protein
MVGYTGLSSLIALAVEPAGANCTYGGTKITAGVDFNANGILDTTPNEVTSTGYACNGAPGTGGIIFAY